MKTCGAFAMRWVANARPWTNVYGAARSLLALATATTLMVNPAGVLFRPLAGGVDQVPLALNGLQRLGLFALFGEPRLDLARWVAAAILVVVASGWRPRWTAVPHWWISLSLQMNAVMVDGGDQVTAVLTLLLLPIALTDPRRWHWQEGPPPAQTSAARRLTAVFALLLIRIQVAGIYFHAAVGKFAVPEWANGTALYYWILHPDFGVCSWLAPVVAPVLRNGYGVVSLTWAVLAAEYALSLGLFVPRRAWPALLGLGVALHAGIIVIHGLVSFSMAMFAALILYLRPPEKIFAFAVRKARVPEPRAVVVYDDACGLCQRTARFLAACDILHRVELLRLTDWSQVSRRYPGLDEEQCRLIIHAVFAGSQVKTGFDAYRGLCWHLPAMLPLAPWLYLPGVAPLGRRVYSRVSARRQALACRVSQP